MSCPIPLSDGKDCWGKPHPDGKHNICVDHWEEIHPTESIVRRERCESCGRLKIAFRPAPGESIVCTNPACVMSSSAPATAIAPLRHKSRGVVYYLRWADRIKIGTSMHLAERVKAIYHDEIVAAEPGDQSLEKQRHRQFRESLVDGQGEWFHLTPELAIHMADIRSRRGNPRKLAG